MRNPVCRCLINPYLNCSRLLRLLATESPALEGEPHPLRAAAPLVCSAPACSASPLPNHQYSREARPLCAAAPLPTTSPAMVRRREAGMESAMPHARRKSLDVGGMRRRGRAAEAKGEAITDSNRNRKK